MRYKINQQKQIKIFLAEEFWEEKGRLLFDKESTTLSLCDDQPVALLSVGDTVDKDKTGAFELWRIYILRTYQNRGIGSLLLNFTEKEAIASGYKEVVIWAFKKNVHAISFYEKHGYKQDKECYLGQPYCTYGIRLGKKLHCDVHTCVRPDKMNE